MFADIDCGPCVHLEDTSDEAYVINLLIHDGDALQLFVIVAIPQNIGSVQYRRITSLRTLLCAMAQSQYSVVLNPITVLSYG